MAVKFGPGGNSLSFGKRKFPDELPSYLASMGLDCYEIECGRGVRIAAATYEKLPALASGNNITVTLHAPYFISLSSVEAEKRDNSVNYIAESLRAADKLGAKNNIFVRKHAYTPARALRLRERRHCILRSRRLQRQWL